MKFRILDKDGNSILGTLNEENAYIRAYPVWESKTWRDLGLGESCMAKYCLSGESGHYRVQRIE